MARCHRPVLALPLVVVAETAAASGQAAAAAAVGADVF